MFKKANKKIYVIQAYEIEIKSECPTCPKDKKYKYSNQNYCK